MPSASIAHIAYAAGPLIQLTWIGVRTGENGQAATNSPPTAKAPTSASASSPIPVQREEQGFLAVEVQVWRFLGHLGLGGDAGHRGGVVAAAGEARQPGGDDLLPPRRPRPLSDLRHAGRPPPGPRHPLAPEPRHCRR
jgi:hypothetical protein